MGQENCLQVQPRVKTRPPATFREEDPQRSLFRPCFVRNMRPISWAIQQSFSDSIEPKEAWDVVHFLWDLQVILQTRELATFQASPDSHPGVLKPVGEDLPPGAAGN